MRSFKQAQAAPLLLASGKGAYVFDYDQKKYLDYVLCFGAVILGHAHPQVIRALKRQLDQGFSFGTTHETEVRLAEIITGAIGFIEKIRFVNSGSEAVIAAIHLARTYTQRKRVLRFSNSYHGHADYLFTDVIAYGQKEALTDIFQQAGQDIAAVIFEPVGGNCGVIPPDKEFFSQLRAITKKYGSLLIADEVITGFRFGFGSFSQLSGIQPDLICLGKIIGGGLPIGAYAGGSKLMDSLSPLGKIYQASTFAGNPLVMQAGLITLKVLNSQPQDYKKTFRLAQYFSDSFKRQIAANGLKIDLINYGPMFSFRFPAEDSFKVFYREMLKRGIYFAPSQREANFLSFAHTESQVEKTLKAAKPVFSQLKKGASK